MGRVDSPDCTRVRGRYIIALPHGTEIAKNDECSLSDSRQFVLVRCALYTRPLSSTALIWGRAHPITAPAASDITAGVPETVEISSLLGGLERCVAVALGPLRCPRTAADG